MNTLIVALAVVTEVLDETPAPEDVKAGWGAFGLFLALGVAVVLLGVSLTRHLRKARDNAERGVFGPTGTRTGTAPGSATGSATGSGADTGTDTGTDTGSAADTDRGTGSGPAPGAGRSRNSAS